MIALIQGTFHEGHVCSVITADHHGSGSDAMETKNSTTVVIADDNVHCVIIYLL